MSHKILTNMQVIHSFYIEFGQYTQYLHSVGILYPTIGLSHSNYVLL